MNLSEKVKCPYCSNEIENNIEQCPFCKEYFTDPQVKNVKMVSIAQYIVFDILTIGLYSIFWVLLNYKAINELASERDKFKLKTILGFLLVSVVIFFINILLFNIISKFILLFMSYRILRVIEKYSVTKYNSAVTHSEMGWLFFDVLYVVYFLDTYKERVYDPELRYHLETGSWFKYILMIAGIVLALWIANFVYISTMIH